MNEPNNPNVIAINQITSNCNFKCFYCEAHKRTKDNYNISEEKLKTLFNGFNTIISQSIKIISSFVFCMALFQANIFKRLLFFHI